MPPSEHITRSIVLASLVVLSGVAGSAMYVGSASAGASNIRILSDQPVSGSGNLTVAVTASGEVDFKIRDSAGTVSSTASVVDGGDGDRAPKSGVVKATLNLSSLFGSKPASGAAMIYAGDDFSIERQTFGTKRQFTIDAAAPKVSVTAGATVKQGATARIDYSITDVPQKVGSATMRFVDSEGNVAMAVTGLQAGSGRTAQIGIPSDMAPGTYNITLTAVDEAGHRTTDRLVDGLTVVDVSAPVSKLRVITKQPIAGSGTIRVKVSSGEEASFKIQDANGTVSEIHRVQDNGPRDLAASTGTIKTDLNLSALFDETPASGTAIVYATGGDELSVPKQNFDTKHQVALDSHWPTANVTDGGSAKQGNVAKVGYTVTDVPQKVRVLKLHLIGPDDLIYATVDNLQAGTTVTAEFSIPAYAPPGKYDVKLITVDEVGHRTTDRLNDSVTVTQGDTTDTGEQSNGVVASDIKVVSAQPVNGSGDLVVRTSVSDVGVNATFELKDASGELSASRTVTDGGPGDLADRRAAVIETALTLPELFGEPPASGTAVVYAGGGDRINISEQTYQTKRQVDIDSDAPTADVQDTVITASPGDQVKLSYTAHDTPPKVASITMTVVGPDGAEQLVFSDLQTGERTVQFTVPADMPAGAYDVKLIVVDEVGHRTTDTTEEELLVE